MKMRRTLLGYLPLESPIHRFHPLIKLFFLIIVSLYPMLIDAPEWNILGAILVAMLFILSRVPLKILKYYTAIMLNIFWIIFIAYVFFGGYTQGYHVITKIGPIIVSWENLSMVLVVYSRMFFAILVIIFFLSVTRERDIIVSVEALRLPYVIAYTIGLAFRSIGLSLIDFNTIREAEKARALDIKALPLSQKIKKFGMYIVPLVALAIRRTDEVSNALDSRGFKFTGLRAKHKRTNYIASKYRLQTRDYAVLALMLSILILIIYLKYYMRLLTVNSSLMLMALSRILGVGA